MVEAADWNDKPLVIISDVYNEFNGISEYNEKQGQINEAYQPDNFEKTKLWWRHEIFCWRRRTPCDYTQNVNLRLSYIGHVNFGIVYIQKAVI